MKILVSIFNGAARELFFPPAVREKLQSLGEVVWNDTAIEWNGIELSVLDVYEVEPPPQDSRLFGLDNVILMPHVASTLDRYKHVALALIDDIVSFYNGGTMKKKSARNMHWA